MSKTVKTIIVFLISFAAWFGVALITKGFGGLPSPPNPITMIVLLSLPTIISIIYYVNAEETKKEVKELSEKYNVLELYKGLAYLMMIAATGFFIYAVAQFGDAPKAMRKMLENTMITSTVSYVITMFSLFCLTKIIDFLFDLDKQDKILVSDKNFTE
jgi:hypothetical protein